MKKLDKKLKSSQTSLSTNVTDCFRQVVEKKNTVFLHVSNIEGLSITRIPMYYILFLCRISMKDNQVLLDEVSKDFRRTGRCNAALAKEPFGFMYQAWVVPKNYSKYENFQRGYHIIKSEYNYSN